MTTAQMSSAEIVAADPELRTALAELPADAAAQLVYDFDFWGRPSQRMPDGDWFLWLLMTGRGFGKNYAAVGNARKLIEHGGYRNIAIAGRTVADVRGTMIEGVSGILQLSPPWFRPEYFPSKRQLVWPNGAVATTYSADEPDLMRGPGHDLAIVDELATWKQRDGKCDAWDNLKLMMREGPHPHIIATTTPRATKFMRQLVALTSTIVTMGHSDENKSNLSPDYYREVIAPLIGTRLGRQEVEGKILEDVEGALWTHDLIDKYRIPEIPEDVTLTRVVIGVDPSGGGDEIGIVAMAKGDDGHYYVTRDRTLHGTPNAWGTEVVRLYEELLADMVVGEVNYGGQMVEATIRNVEGGANISYTAVTASRGKAIRAAPVSALYERGLVHHVGMFPELEDQMTSWTQDSPDSPDRMDAMVWSATNLMDGEAARFY